MSTVPEIVEELRKSPDMQLCMRGLLRDMRFQRDQGIFDPGNLPLFRAFEAHEHLFQRTAD